MKLIILHGWTKNFSRWDKFLEILKEKNINHEFLKIPGFSKDLEKPWNLDDYSNWLKKTLDKEKSKVVLMGHSNGGRISIYFTNQFPEKIEKLILIDSAGIYHNDIFINSKRIAFKAIAKIAKTFTSNKNLKKILYKVAGEQDYNSSSENLKKTMVNLISKDLKPILSNIKIPTLIIWGEKDKITPLSDGKIMNKEIKNSKLKILKDAGHAPYFTNPDELAKIIYEYI